MTPLKRLTSEARANPTKAATLGVLSLVLGGVLVKQFGGAGAVAAVAEIFTPGPAATSEDSGQPLWKRVVESDNRAAQPLAIGEVVGDPFAIDEGQFPPPVLFAADPPPPEPVAEAVVEPTAETEAVADHLAELEEDENAPPIPLQGTARGRLAILNGRTMRVGQQFEFDTIDYRLEEVGDGWAIVADPEGTRFRLIVQRVFRSARSTGDTPD